jgi:O-antigen ligase
VLPFLSPNFREPVGSFYGEATAVILGLAAFTCLLSRPMWVGLELPRASLIFLAFAALILMHLFLGRFAYPQQNLLGILYLLWATLLAMLAFRLRTLFGIETLVSSLSWFVVAGAVLSAAIGLMQLTGVHSPLSPFILPQAHGRIYANTGQPNHLANYLCLGLAALGYQYGVRRLGLAVALLAAAPLLVVLALSGSRSVWFYLAALVLLAAAFRRVRPAPWASRILLFTVAVTAGFALAQVLIEVVSSLTPTPVESVIGRMRSKGIHSPIRVRMWYEAWLMFLDAPLLGIGFKEYAWHHFLLNPQLPPPRVDDLISDNAHNLIFQTMAEFGLAGVVILLAGLGAWVAGLRRQQSTPHLWWLLGVAAILGIHSMLEYPLWYAYFLGLAAVVLGAAESRVIAVGDQRNGRLVLILMLLLGWVAVTNIYQDYRTLQSLHRVQPQSADGSGNDAGTATILVELQRHSLFTPFVELALSRLILLDRKQLENKIILNELVMHYTPEADVVYRHAVLLALHGDMDAARAQWDLSTVNYPGSRAEVIRSMETLVDGGPGIDDLVQYAKSGKTKESK